MKRTLCLVVVVAATCALGVAGCKKKPADKSTADKPVMEAMGAALEAMGAAMEAMDTPRPVAKRAAPEAAMAAMAKADTPAAATTVTITKAMPKPGAKRTGVAQSKMHFTLKAGAKEIKMENQSTEKVTEEVLAVQGNVITKLKVTFTTQIEIDKANGKERKKPSLLEGKTFVLEAKAGKVNVTDGAGKAVDAKLADKVRKKYKSFGKEDKILASIPTTPLKVGEKVDAIAKGLKDSFAEEFNDEKSKAKWSLAGVEIVLKGVREINGVKLAVFNMKMTMAVQEGKAFSMTMHLKGEFYLRIQDGQQGGMFVKGPLDVLGQKNACAMERRETYTYQ